MALFQNSVLKKYLAGVNENELNAAWEVFTSHFHNPEIQANIREAKEESYQEGFLDDLFVKVLGYTKNPNPNYNLVVEQKNLTDSKKADGAMLDNDKVRGVIELKGTETTDLSKVETQAFGYKNKQPDAVYVIISNFEKLRFYIDNAVDFVEFNLFTLTIEEFKVLWLCLGYPNFIKGLPKKIKEASLTEEENVTKKLYKDYSAFKNDIFESVKKHNPTHDKLLLFKKTQKLLDRFLFIFFAEDRNLLPPNSIKKIIQQWHKLKELDEYRPLYDRFVKYFGYLNQGRNLPGKDEIFAYNGGLFAEDELLNSLKISDDLLYKHTLQLSKYDFESEVDVNILGHIFEHSLNEIEEISAELKGEKIDTSKTRRKKDGVFYTPKYITKYIVEHTVGKLCEEKKEALGLKEDEYVPNRHKKTKQTLLDTLDTYREYLFSLTICDPACGSGAFLNQALEFLIEEHRFVSELEAKLLNRPYAVFDVESQILERNLFGVDINEESVEIAKLSLWLRTAQKGRKLTSLNNHIKCGNSLIDDPEVAGDNAFKWEKEFPNVFRQKEKQAFHVTWVTHNARTSQRMIEYKVKKGEAIWLDKELEMVVAKELATIIAEDKLNVLNWNICGDHVHMLLACEPDELANIVRKLKGRSAQKTKEYLKVPKEEVFHLWAQKFNRKPVDDEDGLSNVYNYIQHNRDKHNLPLNKELQLLVSEVCVSYEKAFQPEYSGGFDVVIGNPPYVRQELFGDMKPYFESTFNVYEGTSDLFAYFYEQSLLLLKDQGVLGFISNTFDKTKAAIKLRKYLSEQTTFEKYVDFTEVQIFEGATTYPIIITASNKTTNNNLFDYVKIPKSSQSKVIDIESQVHSTVDQSSLNHKNWDFNSVEEIEIIKKLKSHSEIVKLFGKSYRGIVTGFNEAFIIDRETKVKLENEHISSKELIKPLFEGKDLSKWNTPNTDKYIIFTRRGTIIDDYPAIKRYLEQYRERLTPRNSPEIKVGRKSGPYKWYEIQDAVDYYEKFEMPKITWPNLQSESKFSIDQKGYYINAPSVILPVGSKTILCIINSKLIWFFLKSICVVRSGGYIEVKPQYFEQIPIPELRNEEEFEKLATQIINLTSEIQNVQGNFRQLLQSKFDIEKLSRKLENWHELSFKQFLVELEKARKKATKAYEPLPLQEQAEWMDYFNQQKAKADELKAQITQTDKEIDAMVYELYGLTEEEVKIVEQS
ncbi:MAG: transposase [Balneolaceae bacterium]|nr:transposase [Balneolaceae bacterium]